MQKSKLYFLIMVGSIIVLVAVAFVMLFTTDAAQYKDESTPEGVAQNYLLALQKEDYSRAYGYLALVTKNYPSSLQDFTSSIGTYDYNVERRKGMIFSVESAEQVGPRYTVNFTAIYSSGDSLLGGDQSSNTFFVTLIKVNDEWKVINCSNYLFFSWRWRL